MAPPDVDLRMSQLIELEREKTISKQANTINSLVRQNVAYQELVEELKAENERLKRKIMEVQRKTDDEIDRKNEELERRKGELRKKDDDLKLMHRRLQNRGGGELTRRTSNVKASKRGEDAADTDTERQVNQPIEAKANIKSTGSVAKGKEKKQRGGMTDWDDDDISTDSETYREDLKVEIARLKRTKQAVDLKFCDQQQSFNILSASLREDASEELRLQVRQAVEKLMDTMHLRNYTKDRITDVEEKIRQEENSANLRSLPARANGSSIHPDSQRTKRTSQLIIR